MSTLRRVWLWPAMGFPDRPWLDHPDEDAFARSANSVFELYSAAVREARIPTRHSELRLFCRHDSTRDDVLVMVYPEVTEGFEMAVASLPPGIAALTPPSRALLVLNVIHAAALRLGHARGWDPAALTSGATGTISGSNQEPITVDLTDPTTFGSALQPPEPSYGEVAAYGIPAVTVQTPADLGPRIEVLDGGPMNDVPQAYAQAMHALMAQLQRPPWQTWWSAAKQVVLQIKYDFAAIDPGIDLRRNKDTLQATILRPVSTFPMTHDYAATARQDVEAMLSAVRRRTGVKDHPRLLD